MLRTARYHAGMYAILSVFLLLPSLFLLVATALLENVSCTPIVLWVLDLALLTYLGCGACMVYRD